jgi:tetratricopeptide (TPR) repeat protein
MAKYLIPLICLSLLFFSSPAIAETKVFVEEYTYQASEADSKISSRVISLEQVKRKLLEKLGTYLESETQVKNFQLTKDQIVILTAGIVTAEIVDEKWDGKTYYLKAKITADPKDVITSIEKLRGDRQKTKELEETSKKANEALREVERLKKQLEISRVKDPNLGQYNEAVNRLSATDWNEKGTALLGANKWQEARVAYTRAIELDPKYTRAYANRGLVYSLLGNHLQAIRDYDRVIELDPRDEIGYFGRGGAYESLGDYKQAIRDFDKAIERNPNNWVAYSCRGNDYAQLGDYREAIRDFDRSIQLVPQPQINNFAYFGRGLAYARLGDYLQAIRDYDRAIELDPTNSMAYVNRSFAYLQLRNIPQALADSNRAIKLDPTNSMAYVNRSSAYLGLMNVPQALADSNRAIELDPRNAVAYVNRGLAYGRTGNHQQAILNFNKAVELDPRNGMAYYALGLIYVILGNDYRGIQDVKIAAGLGLNEAQDYLRERGISW